MNQSTGVLCHARYRIAQILATALVSYAPIHAAGYACYGVVDHVAVPPSGTINATFTFDNGQMAWQDICNVSTEVNGVSPAACRAILATLITARAGGQRVMMWFDESVSTGCSHAPWSNIKLKGWYWGPALIK